MTSPKVNHEPHRADLPTPIALGVLLLLVTALLPLAQPLAAYPTELPALRVDGAAVRREHAAALALPAPPALDAVVSAWSALSEVTARRDEAAFLGAQRVFSTRLAEATAHSRPLEWAIRARATESFLRAVRVGDGAHPVVRLAARHALAGAAASPRADDANRIAWFHMRWERMALPTPTRGEVEPLLDTMARLGRPTQLAFAAWTLSAPCAELLGRRASRTLDGARSCAQLRRDMIEVARGADPSYPRDEAIAATDMLLASALTRAIDPERRARSGAEAVLEDTAMRSARDAAAAALQRAIVRYEALRGARESRRLARYQMGAVSALAALP